MKNISCKENIEYYTPCDINDMDTVDYDVRKANANGWISSQAGWLKKIRVADINTLSDEEILKAFVTRFGCDGAVFVYMEDWKEQIFGRWNTGLGKEWVNRLIKVLKDNNVRDKK